MMYYMHNRAMKRWGTLVARVLLSAAFLYSGIWKVLAFSTAVGYFASAGLPLPSMLVVLSTIIEVGFGLMLLSGFMARIAAKVLFVFVILLTVAFNTNWSDQLQLMMAFNDFSIIGGLLMVIIYGPGPISFRCWCPKCKFDGKCHLCEDGDCSAENHSQ